MNNTLNSPCLHANILILPVSDTFYYKNFQPIQDIFHPRTPQLHIGLHYREDLLTFNPAPHKHTPPLPRTSLSSLLPIPITPLHPVSTPVFGREKKKKRQCLLICQSDVVLLWQWWGSVMVGHAPPAARSGSMINQAGSDSNCWQQKHTDSWFGRQWSRSLYLTCHGSQSTLSINFWRIWRDGGKHSFSALRSCVCRYSHRNKHVH